MGLEGGGRVRLPTSPPTVGRFSKADVFNLGYAYLTQYAKISWHVPETCYEVSKTENKK
jgi:hypothetical protein